MSTRPFLFGGYLPERCELPVSAKGTLFALRTLKALSSHAACLLLRVFLGRLQNRRS